MPGHFHKSLRDNEGTIPQLVNAPITDLTLDTLADEGLPQELIDKLEELRDKEYRSEEEFLEDLEEVMGEEMNDEDESLILRHADTKYADEVKMTLCDHKD